MKVKDVGGGKESRRKEGKQETGSRGIFELDI